MQCICARCGYQAPCRYNLIRHLQAKSPCDALVKDINPQSVIQEILDMQLRKGETIDCEWCKKTISKANQARHKVMCTKKREKRTHNDKNKQKHEVEQVEETVSDVSLLELASTSRITPEHGLHAPNNNITYNNAVKIGTKKKKIPQGLRKASWDKHIGKVYEAPCPCCNINIISPFTFHCGHIVAEANGGQLTLNNLIPVCATCNNDMGTTDMRTFALEMYRVVMKPIEDVHRE